MTDNVWTKLSEPPLRRQEDANMSPSGDMALWHAIVKAKGCTNIPNTSNHPPRTGRASDPEDLLPPRVIGAETAEELRLLTRDENIYRLLI
ncbi:hypothetical protein DPEC_G00344520 [Dallia pectoralis]|uniref:Uncharacterized protein n=1 Tax=Dallia pectoralis TaxID=75939 RepID=A0ACC2F392_DALPE|nr:hypothetical protein DPEC_G00344520 [Dallia pectoralis]